MSNRELRHSRIKGKVSDVLTAPIVVLFGNKLLLGLVCFMVVIMGILGYIKVSAWAANIRGDIALSSYVPNGEYAGVLDGRAVVLAMDCDQRTKDGQSVVLNVRFEDGEREDYFLFFKDGSFRVGEHRKGSLLNGRGNVLRKDAYGQFSVAKKEGGTPWLTFSAA